MAVPQASLDRFNQWVPEAFATATCDWQSTTVRRGRSVYSRGDKEVGIYYIADGRVKLTQAVNGRSDCIIGLYGSGDLFGELCLSGEGVRQDSGIALCNTVVARIPAYVFVSRVADAGLMEGLVQYLARRLAEQQLTIATLLTSNSEQRLAHTLAMLAEKFGSANAAGLWATPPLRQDELADMIGTTRSRVGLFLKRFRSLGLIELSDDLSFTVRPHALTEFAKGRCRTSQVAPASLHGNRLVGTNGLVRTASGGRTTQYTALQGALQRAAASSPEGRALRAARSSVSVAASARARAKQRTGNNDAGP